jgi:hypothetical protein
MNGKPDGWFVPFRRTSGTVFLVAGVPFGLFVGNLFLAFAIAGLCLVPAEGTFAALAPMALIQFTAAHLLFRHLTGLDPWWYDIAMVDLWNRIERRLRTRRAPSSLMET